MEQLVDQLPWGVAAGIALAMTFAYLRYPATRKVVAAVMPALRKRLMRPPKLTITPPPGPADEHGNAPPGQEMPAGRPDERESGSGG